MISLSTGAFYERSARQIGGLRKEAEKLQQQIGSGQRLARSSEDAVAAARLRTLARNERISDVDQRNSDKAQSDLKLTDSALGSIADIIIRAQELTQLASSDTMNQTQRAGIGGEIELLSQSLLNLANARNSAGHSLFGGQASGNAYAESGGTITYIGTTALDPVELGEGQSVQPGVTGPEALSFNVNGTPTDLFELLGNLANALKGGVPDPAGAARNALSGLSAGLDQVTTSQTIVGARLGWIEVMDQRRETLGEFVADERKSIGGADPALTMTRLQETMAVLEASQASFVRLANLSLFNMIR